MSKKPKPKRSNHALLPGFEEFDPAMMGNFENDLTLESELLAIMGGGAVSNSQKPKPAKRDLKPMNIDKNMLNLDLNDEDDVGEIDENDPELLAELNMLEHDQSEPENIQNSPLKSDGSVDNVKKLENLRKLYQAAIKDTQETNDTNKGRRYERSLKSIEDLLRKALKGERVDESEFPPEVYVKPKVVEAKPVDVPSPPKRTPPVKSEDKLQTSTYRTPVQGHSSTNNVLEALIQRQTEYKSAALTAKTKDIELAKGLMIVVKQFDQVIQEVKSGVQFDLENLPPPPSQFNLSDLEMDEEVPAPPPVAVSAPKPESTTTKPLGEELIIRRDFYKDSVEKAKAEGNSGKMRRLMRVVQQYDEAIVSFNKKSPYSYEELPPPPGKSPLSKPGAAASTSRAEVSPNKPAQSQPSKITNKTVHHLLQKQSEFKAAALQAKNDGDLILAKELLRQAKGFDQMIQASESGFPVDLSKIPSLPTDTDFNFELVNVDLCDIPDDMKTEDKQSLFKKLQIVLLEQIKMCKTYQQNVMKAGDVIGAKRFESLASSCEKDLNGLKCLIQSKAEIPKFHYEYKIFSVTKSNPDLGENDLSVEVIKAVDLAVPSGFTAEQLDTYIVLELPFPNDNFQTFTTDIIKHTNSPAYNSSTKFEVNPKSRVFQRIMKSKQLKADIFYRKGFLQKDKLLGTANIKMEKFETTCTIHECFDIFENRKIIGGKLEVKLRLRNPISGAQAENVKEKWLVIDDFNKNAEKAAAFDHLTTVAPVEDVGSIEVLKYEVAEFRRKISEAGSGVSTTLATTVKQKIRQKEDAIRTQEAKLNSTDAAVRITYVQYLSNMPQQYTADAKKHLAAGNRDKAQTLMTKKKIVENELEKLKMKK